MFDFSSPQLVDYSIFDTLVDVSVGTLPPRPTTSRALAQGRVPRPRNAFMLFRSAFHRERRLLKSVEKDHRHISRIIGLCWAELSEAEKDVWRQKAELEKQQHALAYPDYRFKPTPRTKQPVKRNVNRNSDKEIERCRKIAKLIQTGKSGEELTHAVKRMDDEMPSTSLGGSMASDECEEKMRKRQAISDRTLASVPSHPMGPQFASTQQQPTRYMSIDEHPRPPFRSPLLPLSALPQTSSKRPHLVRTYIVRSQTMTNLRLFGWITRPLPRRCNSRRRLIISWDPWIVRALHHPILTWNTPPAKLTKAPSTFTSGPHIRVASGPANIFPLL